MRGLLGTLTALKPWLLLVVAFPGLILFNYLFMVMFPADPSRPVSLNDLFRPGYQTVNAAYVYRTRDGNNLFGRFYYTLGLKMAASGQIMAAEELLGKASKLLSDDPSVHLNYGLVLEALERYDDAVASYEKTIELNPKAGQAYYSLALLLDHQGNTDRGIEVMHQALELEPDNPFFNYDLGVLYAKKYDFKNSALYSKRAAENEENFAEAYNNYGYALAHLGRHEEALAAVNKSLELKPDSAAALDSRGFALFGLKRYEEALEAYKQALKLDPTIGEIHLHMAQVYEEMEDYENALRAYQRYLQLTPDAPDREEVSRVVDRLKRETR